MPPPPRCVRVTTRLRVTLKSTHPITFPSTPPIPFPISTPRGYIYFCKHKLQLQQAFTRI